MSLLRRRRSQIALAAVVGVAGIAAYAAFVGLPGPIGGGRDATLADETFRSYCVDCHDRAIRSGDMLIDPAQLGDIGAHAESWEKVVHKLRSGAMPPPEEPRPDEVTYQRVARYLESELDAAAAAHPNAGRLPQLIRLTRTEYKNAIRDMLRLEHLPAEMDYDVLLPADNASSGFDNIADLLFVSPVVMERYIAAAQKIGRLAIGDTRTPEIVNLHRMPLELPQDEPIDGLPFGTRGGLHVDSYFPLDAEYTFHIEMARAGREPHEIEIAVDGARVASGAIGAAEGRGRGGETLEFTVPVSAGPHDIGVTFVRRSFALDESTVRVQRRSRGTLPAIELVTISGPYNATGPGETPSRERIFVCSPDSAEEEAPCAREIIASLAQQAYRRPVDQPDIDALFPFYEAGRSEGSFDAGIQRVLERLLVSPQFLYRIERIPEGTKPGEAFEVSPLELASRLSFFLWSSLPDDELLELAVSGRLTDDAALEGQVARMLEDPRADALVDDFAAQWLFLRDLELKEPDVFLFRDFDDGLRDAFVEETRLFVESILREERSVLELITANYTYVNERLAEHYDLPYVKGEHFRRVELPAGSHRGGLLGQGSILALTSYPTRTSPVLRGKYVLDNLLAAPPPPPPPDVPALDTEAPGERATTTLREAMAAHRANPECAGCHAQMDPIGFAFENFDAVGRWRDAEGGLPIEAASLLPDGTEIDGIDGVRQLLLSDPERFVGAVTEKLLMYALGRNVQYYDKPAVRQIVRDAADDSYTFTALVQGIVKSVPFRMRQSPEDGAPVGSGVGESAVSETTAAAAAGTESSEG
jgi:mono/diheme cytochrome c family protein